MPDLELAAARGVMAAVMLDPVLAACDAGSATELESAVLEALASVIGFEVGFFAYLGAEPTTIALDAARLAKAFEPGNPYEAELLPVKQAARARRGVAIDTEVLGCRRVQQTAYFRDFVKPLGGTHTMLGHLSLRGRPLGALMLGRTGGVFQQADVAALEQWLPRLAVARASFGLPGLVSRPLPRAGGWAFPRRQLKVARLGDSEIVVRDRGGFREMVARSLVTDAQLVWTRSALTDPARSGWPYLDLFHLAAALAKRRERALFVGCGGAVAPRQFACVYPGIELDIVEREPCVVSLAQEFFGAAELPNVRFHVEDGALFIQQAEAATWDVAVVDAFDAGDLADGLANRTFFGALSRVLRPGGTFAFNLITSLDGVSLLSPLLAAARGAFSDLRVVPVLAPDEQVRISDLRNVVVIGTKPQ